MMLKSVGKLREKLRKDTAGDFVFTTYPEQHGFREGATIENYEAIADEIEKEVSERYVELPVDADGVPIRIGDVMVLQHEVEEKPDVVQALTWDGEDWCFTSVEGFFNACGWEHYHAPTVEDVLREFANSMRGQNAGLGALVIAEYAAKLRLAETKER